MPPPTAATPDATSNTAAAAFTFAHASSDAADCAVVVTAAGAEAADNAVAADTSVIARKLKQCLA